MSLKRFSWLGAALFYGVFSAVCIAPQAVVLSRDETPTLPMHMAYDALFGLAVIGFLHLGTLYLQSQKLPPYPGPFLVGDHQSGYTRQLPSGFMPWYLLFALASCCLLPMVIIVSNYVNGDRDIVLGLFLGYLMLFGLQTYCETQRYNRIILAPTIPFAFWEYRMWQLIRALWIYKLENVHDPVLLYTLIYCFVFWVLDFGVILCFLPLTYNYDLTQSAGTQSRGTAMPKEKIKSR